MARPRTITDEQLTEAARAVFLSQGPAAPLAAVAARLGVSAAAVLQRAGSKAALVQRALTPPVPPALARFARPPGPRPARELETALVELLGGLEAIVPALVALRGGGLPRPPGAAPTVELRRALAGWLRQVPTVVSPQVCAELLLSSLEARVFNRYLGGDALAPGTDRAFVHKLVAALVSR
jgi:AcrR family transcriptional regulator